MGSAAAATTNVSVQVFDSQGASAVQSFALTVDGGDQAPYFASLPGEVDGTEGTPISLTVGVVDQAGTGVLVTADNLPPGSAFDPQTRLFSWTPGYSSAGTYAQPTFSVTDGNLTTTQQVTFKIAEASQPVALLPIADQTVSAGYKLVLLPQATAAPGAALTYSADALPFGAALDAASGKFTWTPAFGMQGGYSFNLSVTDGTTTATQLVKLTVLYANAAPVFVNGGLYQVYDGQTLGITVFAVDPNNPDYAPPLRAADGTLTPQGPFPTTVAVSPIGTLPAGASFDPQTLQFTWTPGFPQVGQASVSFLATQVSGFTGAALTSTITIPIQVLPLVLPPVITPVADTTVDAGSVGTIAVSATDPQGRAVAFSLVNDAQGYPVPSFVTLHDNGDGTATITAAPQPGDAPATTLDLVATSAADANGPGLSSVVRFVLGVSSLDQPPVAQPLGDVVLAPGATIDIPVQVADALQRPLTYTVSGYAGASIVASPVYGQAALFITADPNGSGDQTVTVTVTDDGNGGATTPESASSSFVLRIRGSDTAPVLAPVGDQQAAEGSAYALQLSAADAEGDGISYTATGLPAGALLGLRTGLLSWTPRYGQAGSYPVTFTASDGQLSTSETIDLVVAHVTRAPILTPIAPQTGRQGVDLNLTATATDLDGDAVALSAVALPPGATFDPATGVFDWTPTLRQSGLFTVTLAATNPFGQTDTQSFTIQVTPVDQPPVLAASDHDFVIGKAGSFALGATSPEPGAVLTYSAQNLPDGVTLDPSTGIVTWTPGPGQAGTFSPTFFVTDGTLTTADTIDLRAYLTLPAPSVRINVTPSFAGVPGQPVTVQPIAAGMADIVSLTLYENGVAVPLGANGQVTLTPTQPGRIELLAVAVDADGSTGQATFTIKTRDPSSTAAPVVAFDPVTQGAFVTLTTAVTGTVADTNLDSWSLQIAYGVGAAIGAYATLASGTAPVVDGPLAALDPATLQAGFYTLLLTATDITGRVSTVQTAIEVDPLGGTGIYERQVSDLTTVLDGIPFTLQRSYSSAGGMTGLFGPGWQLTPIDTAVQLNVPTTGLEASGVYSPLTDQTRLYLTRPDGVRTGFTFTPLAAQLGTVTVYHPAWTADDTAGGWTLSALVDATLVKVGNQFYDSVTGLPYNPASISGASYLLSGPAGTSYQIDPASGVTAISTPEGTLVTGTSGVTAPDGSFVQFVRNSAGEITRAQSSSGDTVAYSYDAAGQLISARDIDSGADELYAYDAQGRLIAAVAGGGAGSSIGYATTADGSAVVTQAPVLADLGEAAQFTANPRTDTLAASGGNAYTFSLRPAELASAPDGSVLLRVAVTALDGQAPPVPTVDGVQASSVTTAGGQTVALFALGAAELYRLNVAGAAGRYTLALSFAGDVNLDGAVDGLDSQAEAAGSQAADVTGDGLVNAADADVIAADYGVHADTGPVLATTLPSFLTHVDLADAIALAAIATDPFGDTLSFRIVGVTHGSAQLSVDGQSLLFTPDDGFAGQATITVVADDGFMQSAAATVDVAVSAAALTHIDFEQDNINFSDPGAVGQVEAYADFTDETGVLVPLAYVHASIDNAAVATLNDDGIVTAVADGATVLRASRGAIAAATVLSVGTPADGIGLLTQIYGIEAFPGTTTLTVGATRQIVTSLGDQETDFVGGADGVTYVSMDSSIATVDASGLITAVNDGYVNIKVIYEYGESDVQLQVAEPVLADSATFRTQGGVIRSAGGVQLGFGIGALAANTNVAITPMTQDQLALPVPGLPGEFSFAGAFNLDLGGARLTAPAQIAVPVDPANGSPGDSVYFFVQDSLPIGPDGAFEPIWAVVDDGVIGADGIARSASPPYPGLTEGGNILVARTAQALTTVIVSSNVTWEARFLLIAGGTIAAVGLETGNIPAVLAGGALALTALSLAAPIYNQQDEIDEWTKYAGMPLTVTPIDLTATAIDTTAGLKQTFLHIQSAVPAPVPGVPTAKPTIGNVALNSDPASNIVTLNLTVTAVGDIKDTHVDFFAIGSTTPIATVKSGDAGYDAVELQAGNGAVPGIYLVTVQVPTNVLLGAVTVSFGTGLLPANYNDSVGATINNRGQFAYVGNQTTNSVDVIDRSLEDVPVGTTTTTTDPVLEQLKLGATPTATVTTPDSSRVYVATLHGIDIIDGFTHQLFNPGGTGIKVDSSGNVTSYDPSGHIDLPGNDVITALTLDGSGNYLYAAGMGVVYRIDVRYGLATFGSFTTIAASDAIFKLPMGSTGYISTIAVNANSTRLFIGLPASRLFAGTDSYLSGGRDQSEIQIVDIDPNDATGKNRGFYLSVIYSARVGYDLWQITPTTSDPTKLVFTTRGNYDSGFNTLVLSNVNNPNDFTVSVNNDALPLLLKVNKQAIGVTAYNDSSADPQVPLSQTYYRATPQYYDLDNHNASGVAVTFDLNYAFVADYGLPLVYTKPQDANNLEIAYYTELLHDTGSKITVISNPFGLGGTAPVVLGSTTPIPDSFLTSLVLDPGNQKLYALFSGVNNVVVYDVAALEKQASQPVTSLGGSLDPKVLPLDFIGTPAVDISSAVAPPLTLPGLDIGRGSVGLSVDYNAVITLSGPTGTVNVDLQTANPQQLVFDWTVDPTLAGSDTYTFLYVSAESPGNGLWPSDPPRLRNPLLNGGDQPDLPADADGDPGRIYTPPADFAGFQQGKSYYVTNLTDDPTVLDASSPLLASLPALKQGETRVLFDPKFAAILTAGQQIYYGVSVGKTTQRVSGSFMTKAVGPVDDNGYGPVTILTDGFVFNASTIVGTNATTTGSLFSATNILQTPDDFIAFARAVLAADGGGVILEYNKTNGQWVDLDDRSKIGAAALQAHKAVVLVSDWSAESDISDSGFAEAAADAIFAALVDLDRQAEGKLLHLQGPGDSGPQVQFIGQDRGASVNSSIVERFDAYYPGFKTTVTSLDPESADNTQQSLQIPLEAILKDVEALDTLAQVALAGAGVTATLASLVDGGATLPAAADLDAELTAQIDALRTLNAAIEAFLKYANIFDLLINPIGYGTNFADTKVTRWNNETYADDYYQQAAPYILPSANFPLSSTNINRLTTQNVSGFDKKGDPNSTGNLFLAPISNYTFTFNGEPLANQSISQSLDGLSGFGFDDFGLNNVGIPGGVGGPDVRLLDWYTGTVNTALQQVDGGPIYRRASDQGLRATVYSFGLLGSQAIFSSTGWYAVDPSAVVGLKRDPTLPAGQTGPTAASIASAGSNLLREGVGEGFYYSPGGGGAGYQPTYNSVAKLGIDAKTLPSTYPQSTANPYLSSAPGLPTSLQSIYNGNFETGTNQAFLTYLFQPAGLITKPAVSFVSKKATGGTDLAPAYDIPNPASRFPLSYSLPGWSFQGGSGFTVGFQGLAGLGVNNVTADITGLFDFQQDLKTFGNAVSNAFLRTITLGLTEAATDRYQAALASAAGATANAGVQALQTSTGTLLASIGSQFAAWAASDTTGHLQQLSSAFQDFFNANPLIDPTASSTDGGIRYVNDVLTTFFSDVLVKLFPVDGSNFGLLLGGVQAIKDVLTAIGTVLPGTALIAPVLKVIANNLTSASTLTHDRLLLPPKGADYLKLSIAAPFVYSNASTITVTFTPDDNGVLDVADATPETVTLKQGIFQKNSYFVAVPAGLAGRMIEFSISEANSDVDSVLSFVPGAAPVIAVANAVQALSQVYLLDDVKFTDTNNAGPPQVGVVSAASSLGITNPDLTLDEVNQAATQARQYWIDSGLVPDAATVLPTVSIVVGQLSDEAIGDYADDTITIDQNALGAGWYTGLDNSEFAAGPNGTLVALPGTDASGRFDLLTVLEHEYGHALGIPDFPDSAVPGALMSVDLSQGVRIFPAADDVAYADKLTAAAPVVTRAEAQPQDGDVGASAAPAATPAAVPPAGPLVNGSFAVTDPAAAGFGFTVAGDVAVTPGQATLLEAGNQLSSLSQTFTLGATQTALSFTIAGGALFQDAGEAGDAFEVALRDATGRSILGSTGLSGTDDLLDVQADGTVFLASGVTVSGLTADGKLDLSAAHLVTIDVSAVPRAENLSLAFDLTTFGRHAASVTIGPVGSAASAGPVAVNDAATVDAGHAVTVDVLANDGGAALRLTAVGMPAHGTAADVDGKLVYAAAAGYAGTDSVTYTETDANGLTASATLALTVLPAPVTVPDAATVAQGGSVLIDVLGNDTGNGLTLRAVTPPANGTATLQDGKVRYTPAAGYAGPDTFSYIVTDGTGVMATGAVAVTVTAPAVPPVTMADQASTPQGASVLIDVLNNDTGTALTLTGVTLPGSGTAVIQNNQVRYTPAAGFVGGDAFSYTVRDADGLTATGAVAVTVTAVTAPAGPVAGADSATTAAGIPVLIDVLADDTGTGLVLTAVGQAADGVATIVGSQVLYTPAAGFSGADAFSYTVRDADGLTATGAVAVTVTAVTAGPVAGGASATTAAGTPVLIDVLARDTGTGLVLTALGQAADGAATIQGSRVLYTPAAGFAGADAFTYTVADANGRTATGAVAVTVTAVVTPPAAPVAGAASASTTAGAPVLIDVLANDTGTGLVLAGVTAPDDGTAAIQGNQVVYTPATGFTGADSFSYTVRDASGLTATGAVAVTVNAAASVPPAPVAGSAAANTTAGTSVLIDVLADDTGTGLVLTAVGPAAHGVATIENQRVRYTPATGFVGADAFSYTVTDSNGLTATGAAAVTVTAAAPAAPVAGATTATTAAGTPVLVNVLANDTGTGLTLTAVGPAADGTTALQGNQIVYAPALGYTGADGFSYTVTDADGRTATGAVAVTVTAAGGPVTAPVSVSTAADTPVLIDVLANDTGIGLMLASVGAAVNGVTALQDGKVLYTPAAGFAGADTFTVTVTDASGAAATGSVTVQVIAAGEVAPVANPDSSTVAAGASVLVDVLANDSGPGLVLTAVGPAARGTAVIQDGLVRYTAPAGYAGPDLVTYVVTASDGLTATGALAITVTAVAGTLTLSAAPLGVAENAAATPIGIAAPVDSAGLPVSVAVTALPSNGTVSLADGTVLGGPGPLTVAQLTGLRFTPAPGVFASTGTLGYVATDSLGGTASAAVTLTVGSAAGSPVLSPAAVSVTAGASPVAIGIAAPTDPNYPSTTLTVTVMALPVNGTVTLADGTALSGAGQVLTAAQLTGLLFVPGAPGSGSFGYAVTDPAGNSASGSATLSVQQALAGIAPPALTLQASGGITLQSAVVVAAGGQVLTGTTTPGATVTLSGELGSAVADASGTFAITLAGLSVPVTGLRLSVTATATVPGQAASAASAPVTLLVLPAPDATGVVAVQLSSDDIAPLLNAGYGLALGSGTQQVNLVDGVLSVGTATQEAFVQRLYLGLLGRPADQPTLGAWVQLLDSGTARTAIAADFLALPEYLQRASSGGEPGFIAALYAGFLGRAPSAEELAQWLSAPVQSVGRAGQVAIIADSPDAQTYAAAATAKLFARDPAGTFVHDVYEAGVGREVELGALPGWKAFLALQTPLQVAAEIMGNPEPVAEHAGQTDVQYVTDLYMRALGRTPSPADLALALGLLQPGLLTRATLTMEVALSGDAQPHLVSDMFGQPPAIAPVPPVTATVGTPTAVTLSATDPDRTAATFALTGGPAGASVDAASGVFTFAPTAPGASLVTVTATDPTGLSSSRSFTATATLPVTASSSGTAARVMLAQEIAQAEAAPSASALPVAFASAGPAQQLTFAVSFDPAALSIDGATLADGLPAGTTVAFDAVATEDGRSRAVVTVTAPGPTAFGPAPLLSLSASVPPGAPTGPGQPVALTILSVDGVAQGLPDAAGLPVLDYAADAGGAGRGLSVVGGAASGYAAWRAPGLDLPATAGTLLAQVSVLATSDTPLLSVPGSLAASVGGVFTLPVTVDAAVAVSGGQVTLSYDPAVLELAAVRADADAGLSVDAGALSGGSVTVHLGDALSGVLALFDFTVAGTVAAGSALAVSLSSSALDAQPAAAATADPAAEDARPAVSIPVHADLPDADTADDGWTMNATHAARARLLAGD